MTFDESRTVRPVSRLLGNRVDTRPPERVVEERRCWCGTKLNSYNLAATCYLHSARKVRRVRAPTV